MCEFVVLNYDESCVADSAVEAIRVVLGFQRVPRIHGHGETMLRLDLPEVEKPFEWKVHEAESGISVKENDKLVVVNVIGKRRGFVPASETISELAGLNELVVVAMCESVGVVIEDTR